MENPCDGSSIKEFHMHGPDSRDVLALGFADTSSVSSAIYMFTPLSPGVTLSRAKNSPGTTTRRHKTKKELCV